MTKYKDWPEPQCATGREERDAKPANRITIEGPELFPVGIGREIGAQQPDWDSSL